MDADGLGRTRDDGRRTGAAEGDGHELRDEALVRQVQRLRHATLSLSPTLSPSLSLSLPPSPSLYLSPLFLALSRCLAF